MPNPCSRNCADDRFGSEQGTSLSELLVVFVVFGVTALAALVITFSARGVYIADQVRTTVNQNLRGGLDLLGIDLRQTGERLPADFPAVEIVDGADGAPDTLIVRRNLLDEVMPVCDDLYAGDVDSEIRIRGGGSSGCGAVPDEDGDGWPNNIGAWRDHRIASGGSVKVYVYNPLDRVGEFFDYDDDGTDTQWIHKGGSDPWQHTYGTGQNCRIYILEEKSYSLAGDLLQYVVNEDAQNVVNLVGHVTDFQAAAVDSTGPVEGSLTADDDWEDLWAIQVTLTGEATVNERTMSRELSSQFFPRNILSLQGS